MILVTGGASSGKSALGEALCCGRGGALLYIATMEPHGPEAAARIARHSGLRAGKGFETMECYAGLERVILEKRFDCVLLECLGNLLAGEMFSAGTPADRVVDRIVAGVEGLQRQAAELVVITNDVFGGAERYSGELAAYVENLGRINRQVAHRADTVIESVCGLPIL